MTSPKKKFDGGETVAEILETMPEAQEILLAHGLHCAGCMIGNFERLADGVRGHGMGDAELQKILQDLNEAAEDLNVFAPKKDPFLTKVAAEKVRQFQKEAGQEGAGFKLEALFPPGSEEVTYHLDFLDHPEAGDAVVETEGVKLFLSPQTLRHLQNCRIDFSDAGDEAGFKIEKI